MMINDGDSSAYASSSSFLLVSNFMMRLTSLGSDDHIRPVGTGTSLLHLLCFHADVGNYSARRLSNEKKNVLFPKLIFFET